MRLDKYIASVTDYSRSEVKRLIKTGIIEINKLPCQQASQSIDVTADIVSMDGEVLGKPEPRYFMLNKPQKTVSATVDSEHPTVIDLLPEPNAHKLHIAGRLDIDTTGLLLITDDGQWSHKITSPHRNCAKVYQATLARTLEPAAIERLEQGVLLHGEKKATLPATIQSINKNTVNITIREGKYHQVKRMFAAVGNHVESLHRLQIGKLTLDPSLDPGNYRPLTSTEIESVHDH